MLRHAQLQHVVAAEAWIVDTHESLRRIQAWYQQAFDMLSMRKTSA